MSEHLKKKLIAANECGTILIYLRAFVMIIIILYPTAAAFTVNRPADKGVVC